MKPTNDNSSTDLLSKSLVTQSLYRLDVSYLGTRYQGFQSQPSGMGIQDYLERALATFCRHPVRITAASRTDAGVHAEGQVVTFKSSAGLNLARIVRSLNALLPADIRIKNATTTDERFHPIINATCKAYRYSIWRVTGESPIVTPYCWIQTIPLDVKAMQKASRVFIGTHDFTSFCAVDSSARSKIRTVREILILDKCAMLEVWVLGDGFLKQMVRNMVGALVAIGKGKISTDDLRQILAAKNRELAPATAPANGLSLAKVFYGDETTTESLVQDAKNGYNMSLAGEWM